MNEEIKKFKAEAKRYIPLYLFLLLAILYMVFTNPSKTEQTLKANENFRLEQGVK